jgi:uncharacterized phage protein (TIGR02220 family)
MSKDPAFLFYPGDWLGGTMLFTRSHKGAYMDLLMAQFNCPHMNPHMSLQQIQTLLGDDFEKMWENILKPKFVQDENGLYYNQKLENEILRRRNFTESRKRNLEQPKKEEPHTDTHMESHMETENETSLYPLFISLINKYTNRSFVGDGKSKRQFSARIKEGRKIEDFELAIQNFVADPYHIGEKLRFITPEFVTRSDKLDKGINLKPKPPEKKEGQIMKLSDMFADEYKPKDWREVEKAGGKL